MSSLNSSFKTRVSAHFIDAFVCEGDTVTLEGWLTFYDEENKEWKPLDGKVRFYLDGKEIGEAEARAGLFSFSFPSPCIGKHRIDVKFKAPGYETSSRSLEFEVVKAEKKLSVMRLAKLAMILILLLIISLFLSIFVFKLS